MPDTNKLEWTDIYGGYEAASAVHDEGSSLRQVFFWRVTRYPELGIYELRKSDRFLKYCSPDTGMQWSSAKRGKDACQAQENALVSCQQPEHALMPDTAKPDNERCPDPTWADDVPWCSISCPRYDDKPCWRDPENDDTVCIPAVAALQAKNERLAGIVEKLPKTADGVVVMPGDNVWWHDDENAIQLAVQEIRLWNCAGTIEGTAQFTFHGQVYMKTELYCVESTREACEAREGGES